MDLPEQCNGCPMNEGNQWCKDHNGEYKDCWARIDHSKVAIVEKEDEVKKIGETKKRKTNSNIFKIEDIIFD